MIIRYMNIETVMNHLLSESWPLKIRALSKAITFIENNPNCIDDFLSKIEQINCTTRTQVVGLTGLPGAGKSTIVNLLIKKWRAQNKKIAVLAIDPSSTITGGAVLGDRIRMQEHFRDNEVFIRSMGSHGALGGLSHATHAILKLLKLVGFDKIIVETVGIGQSESEIFKEADTVVLVLIPNTGDEVQFMKAGILQLAHIYVINKTDLSDPFRMVYELEDNEPHANGWKPPVICTSATEQKGIDDLISTIETHKKI